MDCQLLWHVREPDGLSVTLTGKRTRWAVSYCGRQENMLGCQLLWQVREHSGLLVTVAGKRAWQVVNYFCK